MHECMHATMFACIQHACNMHALFRREHFFRTIDIMTGMVPQKAVSLVSLRPSMFPSASPWGAFRQ